jgi:hypothetical protein
VASFRRDDLLDELRALATAYPDDTLKSDSSECEKIAASISSSFHQAMSGNVQVFGRRQ